MAERDIVIKDAERAIAMLGEVDEPTPWCDFIRVSFENTLAQLREKEPQETHFVHHYSRPGVYADLWLHCEVCGRKSDDSCRPKFCPECGRRIVWDA